MASEFNGPYVIEHGDVWYREMKRPLVGTGLRHVCSGSEEIAIAHDGEMLLKAGSAASVEAWHEANKEKLRQMSETMAAMGHDGVEVVIVRLPVSPATVHEMNACIAISGRVAKLEENLGKIGADDPSLFSRPSYPR
jgi:hypothetical protein